VGTWPIERDRLVEFGRKAVREAKLHTSWTAPDEAYEAAVYAFAEAVLGDAELRRELDAFTAAIAPYARVNTLGQKLVQLLMPGIPDVYQGTELVSRTLVDPDNRRPVDYDRRRNLLDRLDSGPRPADLDAEKLLVTSRALRLRRERPAVFGAGATYRPLAAPGPAGQHLLGFVRSGQVIAVATRLPAGLERAGGWNGTELDLPAGDWRDLLTGAVHGGGRVPVPAVLDRLPVALLFRDEGASLPGDEARR
jgi:(1->4)-alpha-D-glucan 1-alpha-D-glucosylmutase